MSSKVTIIIQVLLGLIQIGNYMTNIVSDKWKPVVMGVVALCQIVQARLAHSYNPDGTPASVSYVKPAAMLLMVLLIPGMLFAQTNAVPVQHFSLSGSVIGYFGPGGSTPSSIADGYFNLTQRVALGYQQITIPTIATVKLGCATYSLPLNSLAGKKLSTKFVFDSSKIGVTFLAGVGKLNQDTLNVDRIAETAGVYISYPLGSNVDLKLIGAQWLHGGIVNGVLATGLPSSPNSSSAAISAGIRVHF